MRSSRGFTMIEILIAMAILAVAMTALLGTQSSSVVQNDHARHLTIASLLGHDQMLAIQTRLLKDGFQVDTETDRGNFRDSDHDAFSWEAIIEPIDLEPEDLSSQLQEQLLGTDEETGALSGSSAINSQLPSMLGMVTMMIQSMTEQSIRRITLAISWEDLKGEHIYTLRQFVVLMEPPEGTGTINTGTPGLTPSPSL